MDNNQLVEHTYKKHHNWLSQVAYNFTNNKDNAEELVQDLYLRLMEMKDINKIMYNNDVNLFYLYKMVKSIYLNGLKKQTNHLPIDDDLVNLPADSYSYDADNELEAATAIEIEWNTPTFWDDEAMKELFNVS
jgi:DNA-directed RNA polymerase specialized sigma24 family protein